MQERGSVSHLHWSLAQLGTGRIPGVGAITIHSLISRNKISSTKNLIPSSSPEADGWDKSNLRHFDLPQSLLTRHCPQSPPTPIPEQMRNLCGARNQELLRVQQL